MKKILFIELCNYNDYPLGGHLSFAIHLSTAMRGQIDLVGIRTDDVFPEGKWLDVEVNGYRYNYFNLKNQKRQFKRSFVPKRISNHFIIKRNIKDIFHDRRYDIIIIQTPEVLFSIPKPLIHSVCLIQPGVSNPLLISRYNWARLFAGAYDKLFFKVAQHVNFILTAADERAIKSFINRSGGRISEDKVFCFPTRYDATIFYPRPLLDSRKRLNLDESEIIVVSTGRLNWYKGWKLMIDAFNCFTAEHANSKFILLGGGEDKRCIEEYILSKGLNGKVILAGAQPLSVVSDYLNAANLFIMGSFSEGWSTSLVEAVACAKPCVVTDFSSARELVTDGENGFVIDCRDEQFFSEFMTKCLLLPKNKLIKHADDASSMSVQELRHQLNEILAFE